MEEMYEHILGNVKTISRWQWLEKGEKQQKIKFILFRDVGNC